MLLGVELLHQEHNVRSVYMGVDNQAAICASMAFSSSSGHMITDMLITSLNRTTKKHRLPHLSIRWVPGHANIAGNESVDREAKKAAKGDNSPTNRLPTSLMRNGGPAALPLNKSALLQAFNTKLKKDIITDFISTD